MTTDNRPSTQPFYLIERRTLPLTARWRERLTQDNHFHISSDTQEIFAMGPIRGLADADTETRYLLFMVYLQFLYHVLPVTGFHLELFIEDASLRDHIKQIQKSHFPNAALSRVQTQLTSPKSAAPIPMPSLWNYHAPPYTSLQLAGEWCGQDGYARLEFLSDKAVLQIWDDSTSALTHPPRQTQYMDFGYWQNQDFGFIICQARGVAGQNGETQNPKEGIHLELGFSLDPIRTAPTEPLSRWDGYRFDATGRGVIEFSTLSPVNPNWIDTPSRP